VPLEYGDRPVALWYRQRLRRTESIQYRNSWLWLAGEKATMQPTRVLICHLEGADEPVQGLGGEHFSTQCTVHPIFEAARKRNLCF
jgi:hypothetical protein